MLSVMPRNLPADREALFADNGKKRRKIITIDLTGSYHDEGAFFEFTSSFIQLIFVVTDHRPAMTKG